MDRDPSRFRPAACTGGKEVWRAVYLTPIPYMDPVVETTIIALLDAGANGTGGPLLVTLVLGALAAADTARGRMMMRYWEIVGPPPAELGGHWEYVLRHLRLCMRTPEQ